MKNLLTILIAGLLLFSISNQNSYSQNSGIKNKPTKPNLKSGKKVSHAEVLKTINKNTKSFKKDLNGVWLLEENFELGIFPPTDWTLIFGATEWGQAFVSGYGTGNYSMFYANWQWNLSNNIIYTSGFPLTQTGDKLIFDYAYAPYDNVGFFYYDDLEIYYYDDFDANWYSLIYYDGEDLQTAPGTQNEFVPQSNEWGTKIIDIPANASGLYFQSWENFGNNLYIDNIKVGTSSGGGDASVEFVWAKGKLPLVYGVPETIPVLIKNVGVTTMNNLKVYLNITGANNLYDSLEIPAIGPGDTMQVDFMGFTPILNGFCDVTVSLPDDDDNNNNTKTFLSEVNPNTFRYVDSNCCNGAVGWLGELSFLNKYRMSGTGQVRKVNIKISDDVNSVGQIVYAIVIDNNGNVVGKSPHYKLQASDLSKYKTFDITDPKPFITTNDYFYVGIAQTEYAGDFFVFAPQQLNSEAPARPNANYGSGLGPTGSTVGVFEFPRQYGQNYAIEAVIDNQASVDAGISDLGLKYEQYFTTTSFAPTGKVFNAGTGTVSFNVRRTITPGGYTSTKTVSNLTAGSNATVAFDSWTFTSGTTYTVRDSILSSDGNNSNNQMTSSITPRVAKQLCVLWQQQEDRDSLVRAIIADGRYANDFDTVRLNYTGSYRPWKILFANFRNESNYSPWVRDSLKRFIDNSTAGNKKSLVVFGNAIAFINDPDITFVNPADTVFYRQYLRSKTISDNWPGSIPNSESKFRGVGFFDGIPQDSISDPATPELIRPTNGSIAAFKPQSVTGNNNDSCNAVSFAGPNHNTFFMTNKFSSLRATNSSPILDGPILVYTKIIDWIQSVNTGVKVLDLTVLLEGFFDPITNLMNRDTVRVYLRNATTPFAIVDSSKDLLSPSGQASFIFNNAANGVNYYLHIKHRNALETWSKTTVSFVGNHRNYNFTTDSAKAFGNNMKKVGTKWVIFGGDVKQDGFVELDDNTLIDNDAFNFVSGYVNTDVTGDNFVDLSDQTIADNNAFDFVTKITPQTSPEILVKKGIILDNYIEQNAQINSQQTPMVEYKIDHEIYEKFKNEFTKENRIPGYEVIEKGNNQRFIKRK